MEAALALFALTLPQLFAAGSLFASAVHTTDEVASDGAPVWEYLAGAYRLFPRLGDVAGLLALLAFAAVQCWLAWEGYAGGSRAALWTLLAIRLGDCVVSHWWPWHLGKRPNPGMSTTPLYALDAALAATTLAGWWY